MSKIDYKNMIFNSKNSDLEVICNRIFKLKNKHYITLKCFSELTTLNRKDLTHKVKNVEYPHKIKCDEKCDNRSMGHIPYYWLIDKYAAFQIINNYSRTIEDKRKMRSLINSCFEKFQDDEALEIIVDDFNRLNEKKKTLLIDVNYSGNKHNKYYIQNCQNINTALNALINSSEFKKISFKDIDNLNINVKVEKNNIDRKVIEL